MSGQSGGKTIADGENRLAAPAGGERLDLDERTIADAFRAQGYATGAFGKWGLGYTHLEGATNPLSHGFDEFYGIPYSNDMRPEGKWDYARENFPPLPFLDRLDLYETPGCGICLILPEGSHTREFLLP